MTLIICQANELIGRFNFKVELIWELKLEFSLNYIIRICFNWDKIF